LRKPIAALCAFAALVCGCAKVTNGTNAEGRHPWTRPGVLRVALQDEPKTLNPLLTSDTIDVFVTRFMFEPLVEPNAQNVMQPALAAVVPTLANGGISRDGLEITYHLRHDVTWTDGVPVTSADVRWSWQAVMSSNNNIVSRHGYDDVASVDTPDRWTVAVHLKRRFSPFVDTFFTDSDAPMWVAPAHVLARYPNINQVPFDAKPMVTDGPFRFLAWVRNDHITLVANDGYYRGKPGLERVELKIVPDENTSVELLRTHDIDWLYQASIHLYPQVRAIPGTHVVWMNVNGYYYVQMNTSRPPLNDLRVRQAIAAAVDKEELVTTTLFGQEQIASEDIPNWMWAYDPSIHSIPYDPERARRLLSQAGYVPGRDGLMEKDGQPLSLLMVTETSNVTYKQLAEQIQAQLRHVGIEAEMKLITPAQLYAPAGFGGVLQLGKFQLAVQGWFAGIDPDDSSQFTCTDMPPGGYNYSRYCSKEMDTVQEEALTRYDRASRKAAYAKAEALLANDVPDVFINWLRMQHPINDDFKGLEPNAVVENWNAWQWSI
jgi:peptide/nickel transport system substrate-binding protein